MTILLKMVTGFAFGRCPGSQPTLKIVCQMGWMIKLDPGFPLIGIVLKGGVGLGKTPNLFIMTHIATTVIYLRNIMIFAAMLPMADATGIELPGLTT